VYAQANDAQPMANLSVPMPNLIVLTPQVSREKCGDTPLWLWPCQEQIAQQVRDTLTTLEFQHRTLWFYTPTPEFLVDVVKPDMLTYDVMDELANFKFAPPQLKERERRLLSQSAVVFTGGASLYDAKKHHNSNTHLFASGVDGAHYAQACHPETTIPEWMRDIPGPRATYIGVIDERLDYEIVGAIAAARPDVQFLMCGPIVKVDPNSLPQGPNLHYPGQQAYEDLPRILKGTDICLMPFARNEATKFISPTKTLEYMATHRPIVSTPIKDVERFYSDIVFLAEDADAFVTQINAALNEPAELRAHKCIREEKILAEQAWDAIADNMKTLMHHEWAKTPKGRAQALSSRIADLPRTSTNGARATSGSDVGAAVLGGGE